jgi:hypothetical protein
MRAERSGPPSGFQLQLRHVDVDHHEFLLVEQYAIGQA